MDRNEAVLRELNLYPQWVCREQPAPDVAEEEGRGAAHRDDAGTDASVENRAASAADVQPSAMGIAQSVPSADEGLNPHAAPLTVRGEFVEPPASQPEPFDKFVPSADEGRDLSFSNDLSVEAEAEPAATVASAEPDREQFIARLGWPELKTMVRDCTACRLRAGCTQTVFGVGDQQADWLFVGEGPGADEDARGEPFVGQAGKLLDNMLLALKLKRGDNVYIANVVKCRPPVDDAGKQLPPKADEIETCLPYLRRQIQLIQPKVIVALGKTAATALLQTGDVALGSLRETVHDFDDIPLIVTYHPAYLLRSPMEKARAWQDLCLAQQMMQENS